MKKTRERTFPSHVTQGSVLDDLGFSPSEALEIRVKADVYRDLLRYIGERGLSQAQLADLLDIHQPDVSSLLNGKVSRFSLGKLIQFAGKLNLGAQVKLTRVKGMKVANISAAQQRKREAVIA